MNNGNSILEKNNWYWKNRHNLFSRFDEGIKIDEEGLYSVRIEKLALELAKKIDGEIVLDCFGCVGGSAIAFARCGKKVISVELDENRLKIAQNNAKVYGVEDKITFIHGDILEVLPKLDFDIAYFDPPWGGVDYINKEKFSFNDFTINGYKLIELALTKTDNIIFSLPSNFDLDEIKELDFNYALESAFLGNTKMYYDLFLNKIKNSFFKYKDSINITMQKYLQESLKKTPYNKHFLSKEMFSSHMSIITQYCIDNFVDKKELDEDFIKGLHKILYPAGYKEFMDVPEVGKVDFLIPGEYKILPNVGINRNDNNDFWYIKPENVGVEMKKLIDDFNSRIKKESNIENLILEFFCNFSYIHPFADGNGRIGFILTDLFALKYLDKPINLARLKEIDKVNFYKVIKYYDENKNLKELSEVMTKNKDYMENGNTLSYDIVGENFRGFLNNTDEKDILLKKIGEKIEQIDRKFVFTDIGVGSGIIANGILEKYGDKIETYNFVEPSLELVGNYASKSKFNNIVYLNNNIENYDKITNSDFIILIHSSQYINDLKDNIKKLYDSLNTGGILLIVNWDCNSTDYRIKEELYGEMFNISEKINKILEDLNIAFKKEIVETNIFNVGNLEKLDKNSKDIISFILHKPFEIIQKEELDRFLNLVKKYRKGDKLENIENYFWVEKYK